MNKLQRDDSDRRYFSMTPHIAKMLCENVYELALWTTVKMICGEGQGGECVLSTEDLAILSDMSCGKTSDCRRSLIDKKLIEGELKRDDGFPRPVWHLKIPDLYPANLELMQNLKSLKKRIQFKINQDDKAKTSLRTMKGKPHSFLRTTKQIITVSQKPRVKNLYTKSIFLQSPCKIGGVHLRKPFLQFMQSAVSLCRFKFHPQEATPFPDFLKTWFLAQT